MSATAPPAPAPRRDPFGGPLPLEAIKAGTARNFAITSGARAATQLLRFATLLVLARLLAPADFGVLAMVTAAVGIAELFRDLGLSQATIRAESITPAQVNTLFWINTGVGALMMLLLWALAPLLSGWLADPRVGGIALAVAVTFLLNGLAAQHLALLRRNLRFGELAAINLVAAGGGALASLLLAAAGAHYWALVGGLLLQSALVAAGAWRASGWRPARPAFDPSVRPMMSFGGYLVVFGFLTYLAQNAHIVLIGRMFGATAAGLYTRASLLLAQPLSYALEPLRMIAPSTLSRLQDRPADFREHYLSLLGPLVLAAAPLGVIVALYAGEIVHVLLGAKWAAAAPVLAWLALGSLPQVVSQSSGWLYLARGDSRGMMNWGIGGWSVVLACMLAGLRFGPGGVAAMYTLSMYLIVVPCMYFACRGTTITLADLWRLCARPLACAALVGLVGWRAQPLLQDLAAIARLLLGSAGVGLGYLALLLLAGERARLAALWTLLRRRGRA